jgi:hypothetical protein
MVYAEPITLISEGIPYPSMAIQNGVSSSDILRTQAPDFYKNFINLLHPAISSPRLHVRTIV